MFRKLLPDLIQPFACLIKLTFLNENAGFHGTTIRLPMHHRIVVEQSQRTCPISAIQQTLSQRHPESATHFGVRRGGHAFAKTGNGFFTPPFCRQPQGAQAHRIGLARRVAFYSHEVLIGFIEALLIDQHRHQVEPGAREVGSQRNRARQIPFCLSLG